MNSLISIQILRAVAAWLVVFSHYMQFFPTHHLVNNGWENYGWLGHFGVDIFFVISGFIMFYSLSNRMCSAKEFFIRRLIRIVPAYWFYTFLMVLLASIYTKEFSYTDWNLNTLISSLFFTLSKNPSGAGYFPLLTVGWTLSFEMFFYALLSLCILTFGRFFFLACTFTLIALPLMWNKQWIFGMLISQKLLYAFVYGIALGYVYIRLKSTRPRLLYVLGVCLFVLGVMLLVSGQLFVKPIQIGGDEKRPLLAFLFIGSALCFESVFLKIRVNSFRLLRYLGDISYSTYLLHTLVIGVSLHYIGNLGSASAELLLLFITSLTILAISHLSYQYIETGPLLAMLKKRAL
jgi:exopolysaccharide production protein ExoZ